jgi:hypothetical protein
VAAAACSQMSATLACAPVPCSPSIGTPGMCAVCVFPYCGMPPWYVCVCAWGGEGGGERGGARGVNNRESVCVWVGGGGGGRARCKKEGGDVYSACEGGAHCGCENPFEGNANGRRIQRCNMQWLHCCMQ